jgi:hypothetical protein
MEGSGSVQIITNPDPDPKGPKTYGSRDPTVPDPEYWFLDENDI